MPDAVTLKVGGRVYAGWETVNISRGIEQMCGAFSLTYTERWPGSSVPWPINRGDACEVSVDGTVVITGYVDDVVPRYDDRGHSLSLQGRDAAGDLVDCSDPDSPSRWTGRTLTQIAADVCKPYGIKVAAGVDVGLPFREAAKQPGESEYEFIERLCRFRGVLPVSTGTGGLLLTGPGTQRVPISLVEGQNILQAEAILSWRDRHSSITVKGHAGGFDTSTPEQNAGPQGVAKDPTVTRHRPLVIIAEYPGDTDQLKQRAMWEAAVRKGRGDRAMITVQGWSHPGGPWLPNWIVPVTSPWLKLDADMLIATVHFSQGDQGTVTYLDVCAPEGFMQLAIPEKDETDGGAW